MVSSFPGLIAAAHVLHRLLAPRHPPCALRHLTRKNTFYCRYGVFKVHAGTVPADLRPLRQNDGRSLKTQQRTSRSTLFQASRLSRTAARAINGTDACRSKSSGIP
jgi:hypothetical protein